MQTSPQGQSIETINALQFSYQFFNNLHILTLVIVCLCEYVCVFVCVYMQVRVKEKESK